MRSSSKPVRRCYACLLNLGDHCWIYACPRSQWHPDHPCPGFDNKELYAQYRHWQRAPDIRTRQQLRREFFRSRRRNLPRRARMGSRGKHT